MTGNTIVPLRAHQDLGMTRPDTPDTPDIEKLHSHGLVSLTALSQEPRILEALAQASARFYETQADAILEAAKQIDAAAARLFALVEAIDNGSAPD